MRFSFLTLQVADMAASLAFYRDLLGMAVNRRFSPMPGMDIVFLGREGLQLELICREGEKKEAGDNFSLGFAVDDLDTETARLAAAGVVCGPAVQPAPGVRMSFCNDPDGNAVELIEERAR